MKTTFARILLMACLAVPTLAAQGASSWPDRVIVEPRTNMTVLLKDTAAGRLDILYSPVEFPDLAALPAAERERLFVASIPNQMWSLLLNPACTESGAPGVVRGSDGVERFNPFGIAAIRVALSRMIDRRKIVDGICASNGVPLFLAMRPDVPGGAIWNRAVMERGWPERGESSASGDFTAGLEAAEADPSMKGRLVFSQGLWRFDGKPVLVRLLIRADDRGRTLVGRYIAELLEGLGITVERLEFGRARCNQIQRDHDLADLEWSIYTEAWQNGPATAWHENLFVAMYCPAGGFMPGAECQGCWKYRNEAIDKAGRELLDGHFEDAGAYEKAARDASGMALDESVRIFLAGKDMAFVANRQRLSAIPLYDRQEGFGFWTWRSALPRPGPDGKRILRIGVLDKQYPSIFAWAWNPLGVDGFGGPLQKLVMDCAWDSAEAIDPATGLPVNNRERLVERRSDPGGVEVPASAFVWDGIYSWKHASPGVRAEVRLVFEYDDAPWQDGRPFTVADAIYELSHLLGWSRKDGDADKACDPGLECFAGTLVPPIVAIQPLGPRRLAVWGDAAWLWDEARIRMRLSTGGGIVPWPIDEALESLVLKGGKSGASYRFTSWEDGHPEVDIAAPGPVSDLLAELEGLAAAGLVPACLQGFLSEDEAAEARSAVLDFLRARGHAFDSNGPFIVDRLDLESGAVELVPFEGYPFRADRSRSLFARDMARIDIVDAPGIVSKKAGLSVSCAIMSVSFPEGLSRPAGTGLQGRLLLVGKGREMAVPLVADGRGRYTASISPAELAGFPAGPCSLVVEAQIGGSLPDMKTLRVLVGP